MVHHIIVMIGMYYLKELCNFNSVQLFDLIFELHIYQNIIVHSY